MMLAVNSAIDQFKQFFWKFMTISIKMNLTNHQQRSVISMIEFMIFEKKCIPKLLLVSIMVHS